MRDVDSHDRETPSSIKQSLEHKLMNLFAELGFDSKQARLSPHPERVNVHILNLTSPNARIALHLATYRHSQQFIKSTIDDYVLDLALRNSTIETILGEKAENERRKLQRYDENLRKLLLDREWKIGARSQDIYTFLTAVLQEPISPSIFAKEAMKRAGQEVIEDVFASLIAAVQFLSEDTSPV